MQPRTQREKKKKKKKQISHLVITPIHSMASALQKLLRKSPSAAATRVITSVHASQQVPLLKSFESQPLALHCFPFVEFHPPILQNPATQHFGASSCSTVIFPSFPFGFSFNPIPANGSHSPEVSDGDGDDSGSLWADSVKKKRKRKMNKHKYKKLRKRMRRQS